MKIIQAILKWFKGLFGRVERESIWGGWKTVEVKVTFPRLVWDTWVKPPRGNVSPERGRYIVKHKGRNREAIWKGAGWVADFRDKVFMKGVTAWRCAPENLMKIM